MNSAGDMGTPLVPNPEAVELRRRAAVLRSFASRLDVAKVNGLHADAGADTWIGPAADNCLADLLMLRTGLTGSADELRARARALEQRAAAMPVGDTTPLGGAR